MPASSFWIEFAKDASARHQALQAGNAEAVFHEIDALLLDCELPYCFELTSDEEASILAFSPEGDFALATAIDELVMAAPAIPNWVFHSRRQKKTLEDAAVFVQHLYLIDPTTNRYRVSNTAASARITMYVPSASDLSPEEAQGLVNTFLWHALGEGYVMDNKITGEVIFDDCPVEPTLTAQQLLELFSG